MEWGWSSLRYERAGEEAWVRIITEDCCPLWDCPRDDTQPPRPCSEGPPAERRDVGKSSCTEDVVPLCRACATRKRGLASNPDTDHRSVSFSLQQALDFAHRTPYHSHRLGIRTCVLSEVIVPKARGGGGLYQCMQDAFHHKHKTVCLWEALVIKTSLGVVGMQ